MKGVCLESSLSFVSHDMNPVLMVTFGSLIRVLVKCLVQSIMSVTF